MPRFLSNQLETSKSIFECRGTGLAKVKDTVSFHLYMSDSPCGDASIFSDGNNLTFTGAKPTFGWKEKTQQTGVLRTKSGRSDIPVSHRSTSMSCSDKIAR